MATSRNDDAGPGPATAAPPSPYGFPPAERPTLQQQANALLADIARADGILSRVAPVPTNDGGTDPDLPLGHALQVAHDRMAGLLERLDGLALLVGQI